MDKNDKADKIEKAGSSKPMLTIIIILLVLLLGTMVGASLYILKEIRAGGSASEGQAAASAPPALTIDQVTKVPLSTVSTNLRAGPDGTSGYVKLTLQVGVNNTVKKQSDAVIKSLADNEAVALDIVNGVLRDKTKEDLSGSDSNGMQSLKDEISDKLRQAFSTTLIVDVYVVEIAYA